MFGGAFMSDRAKAIVLSVLLGAGLATGCSSSAPFSCASTEPRNFERVVDASEVPTGVYRGAQLRTCGEIEYLKQFGVKTIVQLNAGGSPFDTAEKRAAEAAGIRVEPFHFSAWSIGKQKTCTDVKKALRAIALESNQPVYIHCTLGRDRTGYLVGAYEELFLRKPAADVLAELARHGHHGHPVLLYPQIRRELKAGTPRCGKDLATDIAAGPAVQNQE
jgi:protein tyrosine/serine phosphatase